MTKNSLTAAYYISTSYILHIVTLLLLCSGNALAKNNCDTNASQIKPANLTHSRIGGADTIQSDIGGTGVHDGGTEGRGSQQGGVGGTGYVVSEGGMGGTGVIGIITGFASICVNGIEIHYDSNTSVSIDGRPSTVQDLAVGQVIAARAVGKGPELTASNITVFHAAVGPISSLNPEIREMHVIGQTIKTGQLRDSGNFPNVKAGDWIQVSGHRLSNGMIVASHIDSTAPQLAEAKINGYVTQIDAQGFEVNGTRIYQDSQLQPTDITQGMEVWVVGDWDGAHLKAHHIQTEPTRHSIGNVEHVVIEGYIHALNDEELNLNNQIITLDSNAHPALGNVKSDFKLDQRIQISGRLDADQRIIAEHIELKHEPAAQFEKSNDRNQLDRDGKVKKNNLENRSEIKSIKEYEDSHKNGSQDSLRKEIDHLAGKESFF